MKIEKVTSIQEFILWLERAEEAQVELKIKGYHHLIFRVPKTEKVDYLYSTTIYGTNIDTYRDSKFEYIGLYSRNDKTLYDIRYPLRPIYNDNNIPQPDNWDEIANKSTMAVENMIAELVENNPEKLTVQEITSSKLLEDLQYLRLSKAHEIARKMILNDEPDNRKLEIMDYRISKGDDEKILLYLTYPQYFTTIEANEYIESHQEHILLSFMMRDLVTEHYEAILKDPESIEHYIKRIIDAVKNTQAKTVNVVAQNGDREEVFKLDADLFCRDCYHDSYSTWGLSKSDTKRFDNMFPDALHGLHVRNIARITYKNKVLYEAKRKEM